MAESGPGGIYLFEDFFNGHNPASVADNTTTHAMYPIGPFQYFGDGTEEVDSGALPQDALSGVVRLTTTNEDKHVAAVGTRKGFDVGLMGTIVIEARVQFNNLDTKDVFIGLSDVVTDTVSFEDDIISNDGSSTLTLTASDLCGFYLSSELTDDEDWHMVYNGGTATGPTDATTIDADTDAVAGEWQQVRLEVDTNGTVRWYIDGDLKQTVENAVSTSTDMGVICGVEAKGAAKEEMDVDYLLVKANRDWTK